MLEGLPGHVKGRDKEEDIGRFGCDLTAMLNQERLKGKEDRTPQGDLPSKDLFGQTIQRKQGKRPHQH